MQPLRRVILATLPTMVALLGFMWFRRKKKAPMIEDSKDDVKEKKAVPSKANNNIDGKSSKVSHDVSHPKSTEKKSPSNFSLEENIMISPVSSTMAAAPRSQHPVNRTEKSPNGSSELSNSSHVDNSSNVVNSHVSEHQSVSSSAPKCDAVIPQSVALQQKSCDLLSNSEYVNNADVPQPLISSDVSKKVISDDGHSEKSGKRSNAPSSQEHNNATLTASDVVSQSCAEVSVEESTAQLSLTPGIKSHDNSIEQTEVAETVSEEAALDDEPVGTSEIEIVSSQEFEIQDEVSQSAVEAVASNEHLEAQSIEEYIVATEESEVEAVPMDSAEDNSQELVVAEQNGLEEDGSQSISSAAEQGSLSNGCSQSESTEEQVEQHTAVAVAEKAANGVSQIEESSESEGKGIPESQSDEKSESQQGEATDKQDEPKKLQENGSSYQGSSSESMSSLETHTNGVDHVDHQNGLHSDSHSEVSSDSGKGNSVGETPQTTSPTVDVQEGGEYSMYEFDFPSNLCGRLIGRNGKNINFIKDKTGADIFLKRKPFVKHYQICCIQGTHSQVNAALAVIKKRFPPEYYDDITYEQLNTGADAPVLTPEIMQLSLPEGVTVDAIVSSVVDVSHIFVQQPTHPTFTCLERLNLCMNSCYSQDGIVPQLPRPIEVGVICAAPIYNGWYRAQVVDSHTDTDAYDIKFVDYGGYVRVQGCQLRQIRSDFTTLPFQAVECYLANVVPPEGQEAFPPEASPVLENLVQGKILQVQIMAHEEDGVPYVQLYEVQGDQAVFINRELVNQNVAQWMEFSS